MPLPLGQPKQECHFGGSNSNSNSSTESRPGSSYSRASPQHQGLPPTPPMMPDVSFDSHYLVSTKPASGRHSAAPFPNSPAPTSRGSFYPPAAAHSGPLPPRPAMPGLRYQRPLPQSFPPPPPPPPHSGPAPLGAPVGGFVWQHHHYLNPSHGASFPPTQDRYICQTCNKAFSRPSSLRIHSHSHTGEKPFQCPYAGCGKAFSVRSNMKRHERGCHGFELNKGSVVIS
ncbi:Zinc finger protein [Escovopsis weberi]|uniref:Zinc finger protein n=1 Tax=Escovopsis weberi TaxID=150374 RepID=A0A0N0RTQ8_ESCWE|nr:Zinc finger protein [Escovopsis weberi]